MDQITLPAPEHTAPAADAPPSPAAEATPLPDLKRRRGGWLTGALRLLLPPLATAGLLWLCFFPMSWGGLAWVALVPLLALVRSPARPWLLYPSVFLGTLGFYLGALRWMPVADDRMYATWAALSIYCALYFPVALFLMRRTTRLPLVLAAPVVWVGLEYVRSFLITGFAWYFVGHTQHVFLPVIQVCDLAGVYAVSFLVVLVNAWVLEVFYQQPWFRRLLGLQPPAREEAPFLFGFPARVYFQGGCIGVLVGAALLYGEYRLQEARFRPGPQVALIQGDLDQRIRNLAPTGDNEQALKRIAYHYHNLHELALATRPRPDLIVWPETSYTSTWVATAPDIATDDIPREWAAVQLATQQWFRKYAVDSSLVADKHHRDPLGSGKTSILLGLKTEVLADLNRQPFSYNSALLLHGNGATGGRYDKIHRVPFGEYVPFREELPFMNAFAPYDYDYSIRAGSELTRLEVNGFTFGVLICYEDTDPFLARQYGATHPDGKPVDFLVNMSNDGWFDGSNEHEEHLALCRFRAVETRRSVARAVNMGISAIIDSNGRVQKPRDVKVDRFTHGWMVVEENGRIPDLPPDAWAAHKRTQGVLTATIPIDHRVSLYAYWGDWLPLGCWLLLGGCLVWAAGGRVIYLEPAPMTPAVAPGEETCIVGPEKVVNVPARSASDGCA